MVWFVGCQRQIGDDSRQAVMNELQSASFHIADDLNHMSHLTHSRPAAYISLEDNRSLVLSGPVTTLHGHRDLELFHAVHVVSMLSIFGQYQVSTKSVAVFQFLAVLTVAIML